mmetsp:Transcript_6907/g.10944  ORF Transcript_6907/g.10944 Transcript_6907/m.10944 type:complete len:181 (+) Transcript_6907:40-582(+)
MALILRQRFVASRAAGIVSRTIPLISSTSAPIFTSSIRHLSVRRRRREGGKSGLPKEEKNPSALNCPPKLTNTLKFVIAAQEFLDKIEISLEPMKKCNDVFTVTRDANRLTLELAPTYGEYSFEIFEDEHIIALQTPISGKFSYVLHSDTMEWVNQEDGHFCEGLFVRDLIRQCNGVPKL